MTEVEFVNKVSLLRRNENFRNHFKDTKLTSKKNNIRILRKGVYFENNNKFHKLNVHRIFIVQCNILKM